MDPIDDPVFGKLERDGLFLERKYDVFIFGENKTVTLLVDDEIEPTRDQQEIFLKFDKHKERCMKDVEKSIYWYYLSVLEGTRSDLGDVADEEMPIVSHVNELKALVPLDRIIIREPYRVTDKIIGFLFNCTWDSRGLGVELTDNEVTDVGLQDIVL